MEATMGLRAATLSSYFGVTLRTCHPFSQRKKRGHALLVGRHGSVSTILGNARLANVP
jgi:hypothetical protein